MRDQEASMKRAIVLTVTAMFLGTATLSAAPPDKRGKGSNKDAKHATVSRDDTRTSVSVRVGFGERDVQLIRAHYAPRYRNLPPGLAKKVARGGSLPPGWQKKWEPFPVALERDLTPLPGGYRRGVIDGHAVIYNAKSQTIIDVALLF
jgi:hypothetical protein